MLRLFVLCRDGESGGAGAGGARIPHALSPRLPGVSARDDEELLEKGAGREANVRVHPVLFGRLLHCHRATIPAWGQPLVRATASEEISTKAITVEKTLQNLNENWFSPTNQPITTPGKRQR